MADVRRAEDGEQGRKTTLAHFRCGFRPQDPSPISLLSPISFEDTVG